VPSKITPALQIEANWLKGVRTFSTALLLGIGSEDFERLTLGGRVHFVNIDVDPLPIDLFASLHFYPKQTAFNWSIFAGLELNTLAKLVDSQSQLYPLITVGLSFDDFFLTSWER
jgi:hypothetical protein